MKVCSKCGRTYPVHVDFCLRDGHPLVIDEPAPPASAQEAPAPDPKPLPTPSPPAAPPRPSAAASEGEPEAIDIRTTTDAFMPSLHGGGEGGRKKAPAPRKPPPELAETEVISVARIKEITQQLQQEFNAADGRPAPSPGPASTPSPQPAAQAREAAGPPPPPEAERPAPQPAPPEREAETKPLGALAPSGDGGFELHFEDPQSLVETTLIPRNWRNMVAEALDEDSEDGEGEQTPTPTGSGRAEGAAPGAEDPHEKTTSHAFGTEEGRSGGAGHAAGGAPALDAHAEEAGVVPPLRVSLTEDIAVAAAEEPPQEGVDAEAAADSAHPFTDVAAAEGIPSGFEDAAPPEELEDENTGALSEPFIYEPGEDDVNLGEIDLPWGGQAPAPVIIARGQRSAAEVALEDEPRANGAAPPKGSFRRRAAFSHWPAPPVPEEADLAGAAAAPAGEAPSWEASNAEASSAGAVAAAPVTRSAADFEDVPLAPRSPGRGWLGLAAVVLVAAVLGAWLLLRHDDPSGAGAAKVAAPTKELAPPPPARGAAPGSEVGRVREPVPAPPVATAAPASADVGAEPGEAGEAAAEAPDAASDPPPEVAPASVAVAAERSAPVEQPRAESPRRAPAPRSASAPAREGAVAAAPAPRKGQLKVEGEPLGAAVYIQGRLRGEVPLTGVELEVGTHELRVQKEGFVAQTRSITIGPGQTSVERFTLKAQAPPPAAKPKRMKVILNSDPIPATVFVDGVPAGSTPTSVELTPGVHKLRFERKGSEPKTETVEIPESPPAGQPMRVFVKF